MTTTDIVMMDSLQLHYRWLIDGGLVIYDAAVYGYAKPLDNKCFFLEANHEVTLKFKTWLTEQGLGLS